MDRLWSVALLATALTSCGTAETDAPKEAMRPHGLASQAAPPTDPTPMPRTLSVSDREALLEAIAGSELFARVLRTKEETGRVVAPGKEKSLARAEQDFDKLKAALAALSAGGPPTYLLIHGIVDGTRLSSWLIGPDGGIVSGVRGEAYEGLGRMAEDLGVARLAVSRGPRPKGQPPISEEAERSAEALDRSPASLEKRREAVAWAAQTLTPGKVGAALGSRSGRLLVVAARDTGTAPFAALPLANGVAAKNWSFVVLPDLATLTSGDPGFDYAALDIDKAVVIGDPDLAGDKRYDWSPLPGARAEASAVAKRLSDPTTILMLGKDATRANLVRAINDRPGAGIIYMATHAVADPKNPLTRGFVALSGGHYYAGHIRQERFKGWRTHHPLVVISACQTALGRVLDGGGFGVARTWSKAGAGQVAASLWNVSDRATYLLMTNFVTRLKAGDVPETAMQKAQIATMAYRDKTGTSPYLDDPKMWASFAIYGKPTRSAAPTL